MTEQSKELLVPSDTYLKSGIHIGTKFKTKHMAKFIYKTRPDGLSVLNIQQIDQRLRIFAKLLSRYDPEDILVVSRRETGWRPVKMLSKHTNIRVIAGRYTPGLLTNSSLEVYTEAKILVVTDSKPDKNAIKDAMKIGIPVVALCDTNNQSNNIDFVVPCNNKGKKSLALVFWILANEYLCIRGQLNKGQSVTESFEDFSEE